MSEYQYFEFQAIDRPLSEREVKRLRTYSTRATITPTLFVNSYQWGNFKGDASGWMEKYFDAFLYVANWGTHEFMLRLPQQVLDLKTARRYCVGEAASARSKGKFVVLEFLSEDEGGDWTDGGEGRLSSLIPLRAEIAGGDLRTLYLAWLLNVQVGEVDEDATEPPCPAGLGKLSGPLRALVEFLRIDPDLIEAAAARSPEAQQSVSEKALKRWISTLPDSEKTRLLVGLADGEPPVRARVLRRFREARCPADRQPAQRPRTVSELQAAAERLAKERSRKETERAERERARLKRQEARAREAYFADLKKREPAAWRQVSSLIATRRPEDYDRTVGLLKDLRDLGTRTRRIERFEDRVRRLREEHANKPSLQERLAKAGLTVSSTEALQ